MILETFLVTVCEEGRSVIHEDIFIYIIVSSPRTFGFNEFVFLMQS